MYEERDLKKHPENKQTEKEIELEKGICVSWGDKLSTRKNNA